MPPSCKRHFCVAPHGIAVDNADPIKRGPCSPKPNAETIAGIIVGSCVILLAVGYMVLRSRRAHALATMEANSEHDLEANDRKSADKEKAAQDGRTVMVHFDPRPGPKAKSSKSASTSDSVKAKRGRGWRAMVDDERTWRREIRKELQSETEKVKKDMDIKFPELCAM